MSDPEVIAQVVKDILERELPGILQQVGAFATRVAERTAREVMKEIELSRTVRVATSVELGGTFPVGTQPGPNGTQNTATIWLDDDPAGNVPVTLPVRPGITLTGGEQVVITRGSLTGSWAGGWIDGKV